MSRDVIIPRLGSSDESDEVRVLRWLKKQGDQVHKGQAIVEVETDKVNVEVEAPEDGLLSQIYAQEGEYVKFGAVVAAIDKPS
ncbi:MAG TPA: lipoyl domain-containing protein [Candidatus Binatia bacterium]|jgi:pyruvate dehydrogenase E2 component (dihydrolipoamide acetyltransferase)